MPLVVKDMIVCAVTTSMTGNVNTCKGGEKTHSLIFWHDFIETESITNNIMTNTAHSKAKSKPIHVEIYNEDWYISF